MSEHEFKKIFGNRGEEPFSLEQLHQYRAGTLSKEEALRVERMAAENEFYADVLEDLDQVDLAAAQSITATVNQHIRNRTGATGISQPSTPWWRYAAAAAVLVAAGGLGWTLMQGTSQTPTLAQQEPTTPVVVEEAPTTPTVTDEQAAQAEAWEQKLSDLAQLDAAEQRLFAELSGLPSGRSNESSTPSQEVSAPAPAPLVETEAREELAVAETPQPEITTPVSTPAEEPVASKPAMHVALVSKRNPWAMGDFPEADQKVGRKAKRAAAYADRPTEKVKPEYEAKVAAHYPGGESAMLQFLHGQVASNGDQGIEVPVRFEVSHKGKVSKVKALNTEDKKLAKAAEAAVAAMPDWNAAGEGRWKVEYTVSFKF